MGETDALTRWMATLAGGEHAAPLDAEDGRVARAGGQVAVVDGALIVPCGGGAIAIEPCAALPPPDAREALVAAAAVIGRVRELEAHVRLLTDQNAKLREYAIVDELTGLRNRRFLQRTLKYELDRCRRYQRPLSLLLLDIDHFKQVNDSHGHAAGDDVLKAVARAIEAVTRRTDVAARFGGEEFAIVLPETPADGARLVAERIRERVAATTPVTVSLGVATSLGDDGVEDAALLDAADRALYEAKRVGRDRVV